MATQKTNSSTRLDGDRNKRSKSGRKRSVILAETDSNGCRFADGENAKGQHLFCNAPVEPGQSYCEEHKQRVYRREKENAA